MYGILLMVSKRENNQSLFRFYCVENEDGSKTPYNTLSIEELKDTVDLLLNTHPKEEILAINNIEYDVLINMNE